MNKSSCKFWPFLMVPSTIALHCTCTWQMGMSLQPAISTSEQPYITSGFNYSFACVHI